MPDDDLDDLFDAVTALWAAMDVHNRRVTLNRSLTREARNATFVANRGAARTVDRSYRDRVADRKGKVDA